MEAIGGRVLVAEDHGDTQSILAAACDALGLHVECTANGSVALQRALTEEYLFVLLDIGLPGLNGLEVCRRLREERVKPFVVLISAQADEASRVLGIEAGADDFLAKPFSIRELCARMRRMLRRQESNSSEPQLNGVVTQMPEGGILRFRELTVDLDQHIARLGRQTIPLTSTEFDLLVYLMTHVGRAISREELMERIWGFHSATLANTLNSHMSRMRSKVERDPLQPEMLYTVRGFGYRFSSKEEAQELIRE